MSKAKGHQCISSFPLNSTGGLTSRDKPRRACGYDPSSARWCQALSAERELRQTAVGRPRPLVSSQTPYQGPSWGSWASPGLSAQQNKTTRVSNMSEESELLKHGGGGKQSTDKEIPTRLLWGADSKNVLQGTFIIQMNSLRSAGTWAAVVGKQPEVVLQSLQLSLNCYKLQTLKRLQFSAVSSHSELHWLTLLLQFYSVPSGLVLLSANPAHHCPLQN